MLAEEKDSIGTVARKLRSAARLRAELDDPVSVVHRGLALDLDKTVEQVGLEPLDRIDVRQARRE